MNSSRWVRLMMPSLEALAGGFVWSGASEPERSWLFGVGGFERLPAEEGDRTTEGDLTMEEEGDLTASLLLRVLTESGLPIVAAAAAAVAGASRYEQARSAWEQLMHTGRRWSH
jgi:hypothetical protein